MSIKKILVPQGAEYKAVCKGLNSIHQAPSVTPIPVGVTALTQYLQRWTCASEFSQQVDAQVLIMGLCGSLTPQYRIGDVVMYKNCIYEKDGNFHTIDCSLDFQNSFVAKNAIVKSLTSDSIIFSATQKQTLAEKYGADVVDMEGFAAIEYFNAIGVKVAMVRVVSDNSHHDLPDLNSAIDNNGSLQILPLAMGMLRQPIAASRLIYGSLKALKVLEQVTQDLFDVS